ncbi:MAG: hypothetical protein K2M04_02925, partial [Muribaculaceae bacterium]|nr:hypothetical protein [Muribaculaceae bacterium]
VEGAGSGEGWGLDMSGGLRKFAEMLIRKYSKRTFNELLGMKETDNKTSRNRTYAKIGLICGIVGMLCGLIIIVTCLLDVEVAPTLRIVSGIIFIAWGVIYIAINRRLLKKLGD